MVLLSCSECGGDVKVTPSRLKNRLNLFCSKECESTFKNSEPNVSCSVCKAKFHVKPFRLSRLKDVSNLCCSKECSNKKRSDWMSGSLNHQYGLKGELNSTFQSDITFDTGGYLIIRVVNHPFSRKDGYILLHRYIYEEYLKQNIPDSPHLVEIEGHQSVYLSPDVVIHHINENILDNRLDNLSIVDLGEHTTIHSIRNPYRVDRDLETGKYIKTQAKVKKSGLQQLVKKHFFDAGLDVCSSEEYTVLPKSSCLISTDLYASIPDGYVGLVWSRSGLSVKHKIEVGAGCIDSSYRGEIKVHLYNYGENEFHVEKGDRIAQLLTVPVYLNKYELVEDLDETERGASGFGHTGTK